MTHVHPAGRRKLQLVHGRAITKRRWQLILDYKERHVLLARMGRPAHVPAYSEWVDGFERFMIYGIEKTPANAKPNGSGVSKSPHPLGAANPTKQDLEPL